MNIIKLTVAISLITAALAVNTAYAGGTGDTSTPAIEVVRTEAAFAESTLQECSGKTGDALVSCIAGSLDSFATGLENNNVKKAAPEAASTVKNAAREIRKVKSRNAVSAVLRKTHAKLRRLASRSKGVGAAVYRRTALVLKKALRVVNKRS